MDNVIQFPNSNFNIPGQVPDEDEIQERTALMKHYHIQEVVQTMLPTLFGQLHLGGFDFEESDEKDTAFIIESIRSVLCKKYGLYHPFQKISEQVFLNEETGVLSVAPNLKVNFTEEEAEVPPEIEII